METRTGKWLALLGIFAVVMGLDQYAKWLTTDRLSLGEIWHIFPEGFPIQVMHSLNTGAAFGIFPNGGPIFLAIALITAAAFIYLYPRLPDSAWASRIGIALVIGGALSNALDRIRLGHVVDYFYLQLGPQYANISNFADHAITLGVILLVVDQWLHEQREKEEQSAISLESPASEPSDEDDAPLLQAEGMEESQQPAAGV